MERQPDPLGACFRSRIIMFLFIISFLSGVLTVLAPCVLPLIPVIVGGSVGAGFSKTKALVVTSSLGVSVVLFTLLLKASTAFVNIPPSAWQWISGAIIIFFGLVTIFPIVWEKIPFVSVINRRSNTVMASGFKQQNFLGDILIGASLGQVFSTCSPTYFIVLATVLPSQPLVGLSYLIAYALGLCLMLLVVAFVGQVIIQKLGVAADPRGWFKKVIGILFVLVGIAIITGFDKDLQTKILDAGFFDITTLETRLLEVGAEENSEQISGGDEEIPGEPDLSGSPGTTSTYLSPAAKSRVYKKAIDISTPDAYLNTNDKEINISDFLGEKVVLIDFWTYSCINCRRTIPHLNEWYEKYSDQGLEIIGIHTPEFAFERVKKNVAEAVEELDIKYPVILDNDYSTWQSYGNRYWPRKYLIDVDGYIVFDLVGEGAYKETEEAIVKALKERNDRLGLGEIETDSSSVSATKIESSSPETYFGAFRNELLANGTPGKTGEQTFDFPNSFSKNKLYLKGKWNITDEYAENLAPAEVAFRYQSKNVYMVAHADEPTTIRVYRDDKFVKDLVIEEETLYTLLTDNVAGEHLLRFEILTPGAVIYTFTFG